MIKEVYKSTLPIYWLVRVRWVDLGPGRREGWTGQPYQGLHQVHLQRCQSWTQMIRYPLFTQPILMQFKLCWVGILELLSQLLKQLILCWLGILELLSQLLKQLILCWVGILELLCQILKQLIILCRVGILDELLSKILEQFILCWVCILELSDQILKSIIINPE